MAGNNRQVAVIPINYKDRELALPGEIILDDEGRMFSKLNDGTVKPIRGEQLNFLTDLLRNMWHVGDNESLDYDMASWIKTGNYDPSIEYETGSILIKDFYLEPDGTQKERWRAISPISHFGDIIIDDDNGKTLKDVLEDDLSDGFISTDNRIESGDLVYVSGNTFKIKGDWLETFLNDRKLKLITNGNEEFTLVSNTSYDGTHTTVTLKESVLSSSIEEVLYSIIAPGETGPISDSDTYDKIREFLVGGHNIDIDFKSSTEKLEISSPTNSNEVKDTIGNWVTGGGATTVDFDAGNRTLKISSVNTQRSDGELISVPEDSGRFLIINGNYQEVLKAFKVEGNHDFSSEVNTNIGGESTFALFVEGTGNDSGGLLVKSNDDNNDESVLECINHVGNTVMRVTGTEGDMRLMGGLKVDGTIEAPKVLGAWYNDVGGDVAELYPYNDDFDYEPGDVLITNGGVCEKTDEYMSPKVIGVFSDTYHKLHLLGGDSREVPEEYNYEKYLPVGILGKVLVKVTGDVKEHDLLACSKKLGYGTSINREEYIPGTVFAKALEGNGGEDKRIWATIMMC